jgi:hypothetical protein
MRKNRLFIFFSALTVIFLFGTAALFDQCSILTGSEDEDKAEEEEAEEEEITKEEAEEETEETVEETEEKEGKEESEEEAAEEEEKTAPTIALVIYQDATAADGICFYRVQANVTGNPTPEVKWNRDDSGGVWGERKAQVNLSDPSETFTLEATATNSEGSDKASVDLSWGCSKTTKNGNNNPVITDITFSNPSIVPDVKYDVTAIASDPDGDTITYQWSVTGGSIDDNSTNPMIWTTPNTVGSYSITVQVDDGNGGTATRTETVDVMYQQTEMFTELPIDTNESGYSYSQYGGYKGTRYQVGDDENNSTYMSYISFDISEISGMTINSAHLWFYSHDQKGDLSLFKPLCMLSARWTSRPDFDATGEVIGSFNYHNFACTSPELKTELQQTIEDGWDRFQVIIIFTGMATDNNNDLDMWYYRDSDISFEVRFTP